MEVGKTNDLPFLPFFHNCERIGGTELITGVLYGLANIPCSDSPKEFNLFSL